VRGTIETRVRWNADVRWVGERPDRRFRTFPDPPEPVTLPNYTVWNVGLEVTVTESAPGRPGLDLVFRGENLGAADYEEAFGFEAPGRGIYLGGRVRWGDG
jgi:outer membrane cobalamin receptor